MHRRTFLRAGGTAALGFAFSACAARSPTSAAAARARRRRLVNLVPVDCSMDRIIRTTVGLRPHRDSGFLLKAEAFGEKTVIHNFGHGGAGVSLSWGTASLAADLAVAHTERRVAVIGCGIVGLTSARELQRRGFEVTIYTMAVPPHTTSNVSWAGFTPTSGLVLGSRRTPEWDDQFRRAVQIAYREHQLLVGPRYGVSWINEYLPRDTAPPTPAPAPPQSGESSPLIPASVRLGWTVLEPGEHPFATKYAMERPTLRFEPSIYLDALMRDVLTFGGRIVIRRFDDVRDLMTLSELIIVNCTGLGARALFGDEELVPIKGQLTMLVPQPDVTYVVAGMMPRSDGIALGSTNERGVWTLEIDEEVQRRVVEEHRKVFDSMRGPIARVPVARAGAPVIAPPVESFFGRES